MKSLSILLLIAIFSTVCYSQQQGEQVLGKVTFITSQNVYVKFENTEGINIGDTLRFSKESVITPCLLVTNKSSSSCVCTPIKGCELKKDDAVFYYSSVPKKKTIETKVSETKPIGTETPVTSKASYRERISARLSASHYSNMSSTRDDSHRMMYGLSLYADHIRNSKFSLETFMTYRHHFFPTYESENRKNKFFNVYSIALRYDITSSFSMLLGRKINNKVSSLGALDGLQVEKSFGNFFAGVLVGFRPDMYDHNFNKDLFQYSGFIGVKTDGKKSYSTSTIGYLEQRNTWELDRRYLYFQHSSSVGRKLSFFGSGEVDLFNNINRDSSDVFRLTNLYLSSTYRLNKYLDISAAYDTRKQILYYETYRSNIEQLLTEDESRQGLRFNANVRPYKTIAVGGSYSRRFQKSGANKSDNINGYLSVSKVPWIGGRFHFNYNWNKSNYLINKAVTFRYSRYWFKDKLTTDLYFRMTDYDYLNHELSDRQLFYGAGIAYYLNKKFSFTVNGEVATRPDEKNYRVNTGVIVRFDKKQKTN